MRMTCEAFRAACHRRDVLVCVCTHTASVMRGEPSYPVTHGDPLFFFEDGSRLYLSLSDNDLCRHCFCHERLLGPHHMTNPAKNWYLVSPEYRKGPYSQSYIVQAIQEGKIQRDLGACPEGSSEWKPLCAWAEFSQVQVSHVPDLNPQQNSPKGGNSFTDLSSPNVTNRTGAGFSQTATYRKSLDGMIGDLKQLSLTKDLVDLSSLSQVAKAPLFWGMMFLGIGPLLIATFDNLEIQRSGMAFFFAALWGFVFKAIVDKDSQDYGLSLAAFFFTGIVGITALLTLYRVLPVWYVGLPGSPNVFMRLVGFILQVGILEELCKFIPVGLYLLWKRREAKPLMIVWIAICSGLGFAAFENLHYMKSIAAGVENATAAGVGLSQKGDVVQMAMLTYVLRLLSCVFGHAVYSGIFAYFVAVAFLTGRRVFVLCCLGLLLAATFHGVYDWFTEVQLTFAAISNAAAFALLYSYLIKLKNLTLA